MHFILVQGARFLRQPLFIKLWVVPVWCLLGVAKLSILCVPFKVLAKYMGSNVSSAYFIPLLNGRQCQQAQLIGRLVQGVARFTPWESNCFPQALTSKLLLNLYGIPSTLFLGLRREDDEMLAHAWVAAGSVAVCGGRSFHQYAVVGAFTSSQGAKE